MANIYGNPKRARAIRSLYLTLNRYLILIDDSYNGPSLKLLNTAYRRIPILLEQLSDREIDEKYVRIIKITFSKFRNNTLTRLRV